MASHYSCSLSGAGWCCLCNLMYWNLFNVAETVTAVYMFRLRDVTLERASAITFSFSSQIFDMHVILGSLKSSLCCLGLDVAIVFFQMLVNSW